MESKETKKAILIAEDDTVSRKLFVRFFDINGFIVFTAYTGCEAVAIFQKENIDVILMDVRMPEMDGFTAVKIIREYEKKKGKRVPIIAVTACAITGDREKCIEAGMDDYVTKPVNLDHLLKIVNQWVM